MNIKVLLVDDHQLFIQGIKQLLESEEDIEVIDTITEPSCLLDVLKYNRPDIIIIDVHMKNYNGIKMTGDILNHFPEVQVIVLSGYDYQEYYDAAFNIGASAYLTKERSVLELANAIRQVFSGYTFFPQKRKNTYTPNLTLTENKVLSLISRDKTNLEISIALHMSKRTVEYHISSILRKLDVSSRVGAVVKGIQMGIIGIK